MYRHLAKAYHIGQVAFAIIVIMFGAGFGLRYLFENQIFYAICFGVIGYISGYRMWFKTSMAELKRFNARSDSR